MIDILLLNNLLNNTMHWVLLFIDIWLFYAKLLNYINLLLLNNILNYILNYNLIIDKDEHTSHLGDSLILG